VLRLLHNDALARCFLRHKAVVEFPDSDLSLVIGLGSTLDYVAAFLLNGGPSVMLTGSANRVVSWPPARHMNFLIRWAAQKAAAASLDRYPDLGGSPCSVL
jgi:hypothetical protein